MSNSVDFWYLLISRRATVPGLKRWGFFTPPVAAYNSGNSEDKGNDDELINRNVKDGRGGSTYGGSSLPGGFGSELLTRSLS